MEKEALSVRHAIFMNVLFLFGNISVVGINFDAEQDSWLTLLLAAIFAFPFLMMLARITQIYPEQDFFEILEILFGKVGGRILILLMSWYALHLSSLVLQSFTEFVEISVMPETPQLPIMIGMILVVAYMGKMGLQAIGKWSYIMMPIATAVVIFTIVFSLNNMDFDNIFPIFSHSPATIASGAFELFAFPYMEMVLFICISHGLKEGGNPYRMYAYSLVISTVILLAILLRNIFVLGPVIIDMEYFPSYTAARIINIGELITRLEGTIAMNFIISGILKICLCLVVAAKGISHLFGVGNYKKLIVPLGLLSMALSNVLFNNITELFEFIEIYPFYALPFQVFIPALVWITAEIRLRKQRPPLRQAPAENS